MISCSCSYSVYPIVRGEIDSFCGSTCSIKRCITFHQRTSSPRQTERAWISVTRCTILIQIELACQQSTSKPDRTLCSTENRAQLFVDMCVWWRERDRERESEREIGLQWLIWLECICSSHGLRLRLVYELLFLCWAHHLWPKNPHLHGNRYTHIEISLYENPLNLYD